MPEAKEDFEKIDRFLKFAQSIDTFQGCNTVYELFKIADTNAPYSDIEREIQSFVNLYIGSNAPKFKQFGKLVAGEAETVKRVLRDHRTAYDKYLQEHDPRIQKLRGYFIFCTKRDDNKLDSKEKANLIGEAKDVGLSDAEAIKLINKWLIEYGVEESEDRADSSATSSTRPFTDFLGKTYYEIFGVSDGADYAEIKEAYDKEYSKYNTSRDKAKASARFFVVSEAWECLRDPTKRREYDEKLKQPKTFVPTGEPRLVVECKSDYTFRDVRRGMVINEKIIIKNPEGGLLQGMIKSDSPWLEPDRNKVLEKHEQELYINILTSKIPSKAFEVEGNIAIDTNGGSHIIPFKVFLESYKIELQKFQKTWVPLFSAFCGLAGSFIKGQNLWGLAYITAIPFGIWYKMQYISEQGIKKDLEIVKQIAFGILMGVGGLIAVAILQAIFQSLPHFSGFLIGASVFGVASYLFSKKGLEFSLNKGFDISKYPPAIIQGTSVGLAVLAMVIHSGSKSEVYKPAPPISKVPAATTLKITRSVIAEGLDSNNNPIGINTIFSPGNKKLCYFVSYTGAAPDKTEFIYRWYKGTSEIGKFQFTPKHESGNAWSFLMYNFDPGTYEVKLYVGGQEINKNMLAIVSSTQKQIEEKNVPLGRGKVVDDKGLDLFDRILDKETKVGSTIFSAGHPYGKVNVHLPRGQTVEILALIPDPDGKGCTLKVRSGGYAGYTVGGLEFIETLNDKGAIASVYLSLPYEYEGDVGMLNRDIRKFETFITNYPNSQYVPKALLEIGWRQFYLLQVTSSLEDRKAKLRDVKNTFKRLATEYSSSNWSKIANEIYELLTTSEAEFVVMNKDEKINDFYNKVGQLGKMIPNFLSSPKEDRGQKDADRQPQPEQRKLEKERRAGQGNLEERQSADQRQLEEQRRAEEQRRQREVERERREAENLQRQQQRELEDQRRAEQRQRREAEKRQREQQRVAPPPYNPNAQRRSVEPPSKPLRSDGWQKSRESVTYEDK